MTKINDGGPAFPRAPFTFADRQSGLDWSVTEQPGMTLRQYYAGQIIAGLAVGCAGMIGKDFSAYADGYCNAALAGRAVVLADALIAELKKVKP
jgi:hypothetical protein